MELSKPIDLEYTKKNFMTLLAYGAQPDRSPYTHKQIAEWCERFWNKYSDVDAPEEIESIMPILADVETQWDLFLVDTYTADELSKTNFESLRLPVDWFVNWAAEANV